MIKKILIFLIPIVIVFAFGFKPKDKPTKTNGNIPYRIIQNPNQIQTVGSVQMNANQINTWFRNNGSFNRDPSTGNSGFEFPNGSLKFSRYASGLWVGAVVGGDTLVCIAEYDYEYLPGNIPTLGGDPVGSTDPNFKVYNISSSDTSQYADWRTYAVPQGAYLDSNGNPNLMGNQTLFYSYTDGYPEAHGNNAGSTAPLKAVILQTNWCYAANGPLSTMAFSEFRIINRNTLPWTNTFIAVWTDDDVGQANDDACGVDTLLDLGYTYNFDNADGVYGAGAPAVGYDYFRGPIIPSIGDTVRYYSPPGSNHLITKPNYRELGVTGFSMYTNGLAGAGDPANYIETYNNLQGIRSNGTYWTDPVTGLPTVFPFSGDPEAGTGYNMPNGDDRRFMQCSGPLVVNPGDTQSIVVAQLITRGENNLKSVTKLKGLSLAAQRIFDNNFQIPNSPTPPVTSSYAPGNGRIYLSWGDQNEKDSIVNKLSGGVYKFQGYNIYAIRVGTNGTSVSDRTLINTFDVKDGITNIKDSIFSDEFETYVYTTVQRGSDNGISRYIVIDKDYINNGLLISGTPYKFAVTAYYYDPKANLENNVTAKVSESPISNSSLTVTPQTLSPGTVVNYNVGDTIYTSQRDLGSMPIVFEPLNLTSATYKATYGGTLAAPNWTLTKTANGSTSTLYSNVPDFTGKQDTAKTVDGFLAIFQNVKDSGVIVDPANGNLDTSGKNFTTRQSSWTYSPSGAQWFRGPDTTAVKTAKIITGRQFQSRSLGMSFPTTGTFKNSKSKILANVGQFSNVAPTSPILTGGPLRKIKIVFGDSSKAYRFIPTDTTYSNTPCAPTMASIPFKVFAADELDSSGGALRQLNVGFMDADLSGTWNPDTSKLGGYEFTYIFASNYDAVPNTNYLTKNPALNSPALGFPALDVMYAWLPRVGVSSNGVPLKWANGDTLTVAPYRLTKPAFVPGYPISYSWTVDGTQTGNQSVAASQLSLIKAYPNPYFGGQALETDPFNRFINISHLPNVCTIYIYSLSGTLVKQINRNANNDPNNSIERWDLLNSSQIPVASGMYIIFIDAGSLGATTLKVAIFTPTERIQTF
jgi:hypothetical protein